MILITQNLEDVSYSELMSVYDERNQKAGAEEYPHYTMTEQRLLAEQDLYSYLRFALEGGAWFAAWVLAGSYKSALRLEPYRDGLLITSLETAPDCRCLGYANALLRSINEHLPFETIYAHIYNDNVISMHLHEKNDFVLTQQFAELLDGTITKKAYTYVRQSKK